MPAVFIINPKILDHSIWSKIEEDWAQKGPEWLEIKPKSQATSKLTFDGKPSDKFIPSKTEPDWGQKGPERVEENPKSGLASKLGSMVTPPLDHPVSPKIAPDSERKKGDATVIADAVKSIMDARSRKP